MLSEQEVMKMLEDTKAVLHGHFLLTSGLHSPMYVEKFNVLQHPEYTEKLCKEIARRYENDNIELVVGPTTGGILLAHECGKALGTRAIFTERENGKMTLKRGFEIPAGTRCLVVEDIVTTGGSVREVMDVVKEHGGVIVGVGLGLFMPVRTKSRAFVRVASVKSQILRCSSFSSRGVVIVAEINR